MIFTRAGFCGPMAAYQAFLPKAASTAIAFWCALTGMSGMTGGGELGELGGY